MADKRVNRQEREREAAAEFAFWNGSGAPVTTTAARRPAGRATLPTRAVRVRIRNVMGLEEVEFPLGDVTEIRADNGLGKSSALEAISSLFRVSDSSRLLRRGAEDASIWMLFDDGSEVERTITPEGTELTGKDGAGLEMTSARAFLDKIANLASLRPADFLDATDAQRINMLLKAVPLRLDASFREWARKTLAGLIKPAELDQHAVLAVARLEEVARSERTVVGREVTRRRAAEAELRDTLLPREEMRTDWGARVMELQAERSKADRKRHSSHLEVEKVLAGEKAEAEAEYQAAVATARLARDERIRAAQEATSEALREADRRHATATQTIVSELATASEKLSQVQQAEAQYKVADRLARELAESEARHAELEEALKQLAEEKQRMLRRLPVSGLEISGGRLYRSGVLFDDLNTAQQIEIVLELAELVAGRVPIILADGMERLTPPRREALIEAAVGRGMQFVFATATADAPFHVEVRGAA